jgi:4-aminobutyrate aminotransferase-like enzyme
MDAAWPPSSGEAIHTSTFLGHPVGCAMALANLGEIESNHLVERSAQLGAFLLARLDAVTLLYPDRAPFRAKARGLGLLAGLELLSPNGDPATKAALATIKSLLRRGYIFLPEGEHANVISFTPPLTISHRQLEMAVDALKQSLPLSQCS